MEPILEINGISKKYSLTGETSDFPTLGDSLKRLVSGKKRERKEFHALQDVSFSVFEGETVGIIGRNGAGKSTLLKIISRITTPTSGKIISRGRIASLLEVGTGFHPELSGKENIYLNGVILGMTRAEINSRMEEIIDFSGVEKFIDTPLKHYSSGMQLRLAFAVAAFLEPEILIIDEVLAVGDAEFQKKCIGKMQDVSKNGRTILFVSHNLSVLKTLCTKSLLLSGGRKEMFGNTDEVVLAYQKSLTDLSKLQITGTRTVQLKDFKILDASDKQIESFNSFDDLRFRMVYESFSELANVSFGICFDNISKQRVTSIWSAYKNVKYDLKKVVFELEISVPKLHLIPGIYEIILYVEASGVVIERIDNFKNIVIGLDMNVYQGVVPNESQGLYIEDFKIRMEEK